MRRLRRDSPTSTNVIPSGVEESLVFFCNVTVEV